MELRAGSRLVLLLLTFVPPAILLVAGFPWAALGLLLLLHLPLVWGTLWPHSRLFGPVLTRLPTTSPQVWLTIDDGPSGDTLALLDVLEQQRAKATFFLVGERAARHPDLVAAIQRGGHAIGNHSAAHPAAWFWALSPGRMDREIGEAQRVLTELTGTPPSYFRAVVGHANPFVAPALTRHGLTRVSWSARGYDGVSGDVERVVARIAQDLQPGAIVLLHEGAPHGNSIAILERVLEMLAARGLQPVLPADLLSDGQRPASC